MMGTLNYMAPEQVRGERTDHRADIFSFGVVLYEMLSGRKAFQGDSFATTLYKILQDVPEPLHNIDSTLPYELVWLVEKTHGQAEGRALPGPHGRLARSGRHSPAPVRQRHHDDGPTVFRSLDARVPSDPPRSSGSGPPAPVRLRRQPESPAPDGRPRIDRLPPMPRQRSRRVRVSPDGSRVARSSPWPRSAGWRCVTSPAE